MSMKVIRGQIMVMRGQVRVMRGHIIQNIKMFVMLSLDAQLSFDIHHVYVLTWPYFLCNTAVFSFCLICNMPLFLVIAMLTIIKVWRSIKVIRGQLRVMRGHIIKNSKMLSHMIS